MEESRRAMQYNNCLKESPWMYRAARRMEIPAQDAAALVFSRVLGPALAGFVRWLLVSAVKSGKRRLYFLARDGYFMYRTALVFCKAFRLPIECRYLSCSRHSIRIPMLHLDREAALDAVCRGGIAITPAKILRRAGLTRPETRQVLDHLSPAFPAHKEIPYAKLPDMRSALAGCKPFLAFMDRHSKAAMPAFAGYLQQEGLLDGIADAIVDSGWTGSTQKALGQALALMGRSRKLEGYYFGLYELPPGSAPTEFHTYFFGPYRQRLEKVSFNNNVFEAVYSAPHGTTLRYRKKGEVYLPCYATLPESRKAYLQKAQTYLLQYVRLFAEETGRAAFFTEDFQKDRLAVRKVFRLFMTTPNKQEAELFGSLPFSDDILEGNAQPLAPLLTERELRSHHLLPRLFFLAGLSKGQPRESAWLEGSAARSGTKAQRHSRQYALYQKVRYFRKERKERRKQNGRS